MYIKKVKINNFRTFLNFEVNFDKKFQVIAGANNAGKTNILRALNLFFNDQVNQDTGFCRENDLPYHVIKASGSQAFLDIELDIFLEDNEIAKIKGINKYLIFGNILRTKKRYDSELIGWYHSDTKGFFPKVEDLKKGKNEIQTKSHLISILFRRIKFIYVPSQFDINKTVSNLVSEEILPTAIDGYGDSGLAKKVRTLRKSIEKVDRQTQMVLNAKNKILTEQFQETIRSFPEIQAGLGIDDFSLNVKLLDDSLNGILSKRIFLEVSDASHNSIDSKGSGIQKLVLITLLEYFTRNVAEKARYTNPFIIWAIDEPEVYMQPKLQKKIRGIFERVSESNQVLITTHSPSMIDIYSPDNVKLFYLKAELKAYKRKQKQAFYKKMTQHKSIEDAGFVEELKEHFGIESNDGWILRNKNVLFEGEDDKNYIQATYKAFLGYPLDSACVTCESASNFPSFVELLSQRIAVEKLKDKTLFCLLDDDTAGREAYKKILKKNCVKAYKIKSSYLEDKDNLNDRYPKMIEDFVVPEIFFKSIKEFIKSKDRKADLSKYKFDKFFEERKKYKQQDITSVCDNFFDDAIKRYGTKFFFGQLSVKFAISLIYGDNMSKEKKNDIDKYKDKYPEILKLFKEIV